MRVICLLMLYEQDTKWWYDSFIAIALLVSLGILEGFFHMRWVRSRKKVKNYFVNCACFGVVKVA